MDGFRGWAGAPKVDGADGWPKAGAGADGLPKVEEGCPKFVVGRPSADGWPKVETGADG